MAAEPSEPHAFKTGDAHIDMEAEARNRGATRAERDSGIFRFRGVAKLHDAPADDQAFAVSAHLLPAPDGKEIDRNPSAYIE
jgi:hypothetical protein